MLCCHSSGLPLVRHLRRDVSEDLEGTEPDHRRTGSLFAPPDARRIPSVGREFVDFHRFRRFPRSHTKAPGKVLSHRSFRNHLRFVLRRLFRLLFHGTATQNRFIGPKDLCYERAGNRYFSGSNMFHAILFGGLFA